MKATFSTSLTLLTSFSRYCGGFKSALPGVASNQVGQRLGALQVSPNTSRTFFCSLRNIHRSQSTGENPGSQLRMANERHGDKVQKNGLFLFDFDGGEHISCTHWKSCLAPALLIHTTFRIRFNNI